MRVIGEQAGLLIIEDEDGNTSTTLKTNYLLLKHKTFDGNSIFYKYNDKQYVEETYEDGIFNCWNDGKMIQVADAEGIATCIQDQNLGYYTDIFTRWYNEKIQHDIIESLIGETDMRRITLDKESYIIDNLFKVARGVSYYRDGEDWAFVCLVAKDAMHDRVLRIGHDGVIIGANTMVTLAKIKFLLNPNWDNCVFANQIPENIKTKAENKIKRFKKHLTKIQIQDPVKITSDIGFQQSAEKENLVKNTQYVAKSLHTNIQDTHFAKEYYAKNHDRRSKIKSVKSVIYDVNSNLPKIPIVQRDENPRLVYIGGKLRVIKIPKKPTKTVRSIRMDTDPPSDGGN